MLSEYDRPVAHESWLTAEERSRMSECNRGAASHHRPAPEAEPERPEPRKSAAKSRRAAKQRTSGTRSRAEEHPSVSAADEREAMRMRMVQSENNRRHANGEALEVVAKPETEAAAAPFEAAAADYQDEYDTGRCHAAAVARNYLRSDPDYRHGWFLSFSFISGSAALRPDAAEAEQPLAAPETAIVEMRAAAAESSESRGSSRKVSGSRYGDGAHSGGYQRRITTGGAVIIGLLTVLLIGCVIYGKVQTNEVYTKIAELQAEYDDINEKNVSMKSEMEGKLTVKNIEDYAENVLGLIPLDRSQIQYIRIQTEDEVIITEPEDNFIVTINDYITSFWEFLRGA